jgi:LemA protein
MRHERETLDAVLAARNQAAAALQSLSANPGDPANIQNLLQAEESLGNVLGRLMKIAEVYPELKASQTMIQLTEELAANGRNVFAARASHNQAVTRYNVVLQAFPMMLIGGFLGFQKANLFEAEKAAEQEPPAVRFA